jgi:transposase
MKHPGGRPTDYKPEYCEEAIELLDKGKSKIQLCRHFRIAKSTLQQWEQNHPEFSAAINEGVGYSEAVWMDKGEDNLCNRDFNSRLWELNMMNRFGWMKRTDQNTKLSGDVGVHETERKFRQADSQYNSSDE